MISPTVICQTAGQLVTGVAAAINSYNSPTNQLQRVFYQLGDVAWDNCQCGMLALSLGRMYLSRNFPVDTTQLKVGNCATNYHVQDCQLLIVRCFPIEGDDSNNALVTPPKVADLEAATQVVFADAVIAWQTLDCMLNSMFKASPQQVAEYVVQDWNQLGPLGGCGGLSINFKIGWMRDCGCE